VRAYSFNIQSAAEFNHHSTRGRFRQVMSSLDAIKAIRAQAIRPVVSMEGRASFPASPVAPRGSRRNIRKSPPKSLGGSPPGPADRRHMVCGTDARVEREATDPVSYAGYNIHAVISENGAWSATIRTGSGNRDLSFKTDSYLSKALAIADAQIWIDEHGA
jgi:hypothetical protein